MTQAPPSSPRSIVVFDLGGVLIDWNPRHLYRKLFAGDDAAMEHFLTNVCTQDWNEGQDGGRSFADAAALLKADHPDKGHLIDAFGERFDEMMSGAIEARSRFSARYARATCRSSVSPTGRRKPTRWPFGASSSCAGFAASWFPARSA